MDKQKFRRFIQTQLQRLSFLYKQNESEKVTHLFLNSTLYKEAKAISLYLSTEHEVSMDKILSACFNDKKKVYLPFVYGKSSESMDMLLIQTYEEIQQFDKNQWNIQEPSRLDRKGRKRTSIFKQLEPLLIIVPGVAFDLQRNRIGRGKGYYDSFIQRIQRHYASHQKSIPLTIALAFSEQIVPSLPIESHDQTVDYLLSSSNYITPKSC